MVEKYKFNKIEKNFAFLNDITVKSLLDKWNVDFGIHSFNYDKEMLLLTIKRPSKSCFSQNYDQFRNYFVLFGAT